MDIVKAFLDVALLGSAWVLWLLVILSVISIAVILERIYYFSQMKLNFAAFHQRMTELLNSDKVAEATELCRQQAGPEARVALMGFENAGNKKSAKALEETMQSYLIGEKQNLDRGLVILGTLGNNAPFIGLFGTVIGVIQAFHLLGINPAGGPSVVMGGISEALVATAVGLIVAIPAVIAFNAFQRVVKRRLSNAEMVMKMVVAYFARS